MKAREAGGQTVSNLFNEFALMDDRTETKRNGKE